MYMCMYVCMYVCVCVYILPSQLIFTLHLFTYCTLQVFVFKLFPIFFFIIFSFARTINYNEDNGIGFLFCAKINNEGKGLRKVLQ